MIDKIFKNKHKQWAIAEKPNLPIIVWFISWILSHVLPYGQLNFAAALIAFGSLFTWAWLEAFQGSCYFRRALGVVVLIWLVHSRI